MFCLLLFRISGSALPWIADGCDQPIAKIAFRISGRRFRSSNFVAENSSDAPSACFTTISCSASISGSIPPLSPNCSGEGEEEEPASVEEDEEDDASVEAASANDGRLEEEMSAAHESSGLASKSNSFRQCATSSKAANSEAMD